MGAVSAPSPRANPRGRCRSHGRKHRGTCPTAARHVPFGRGFALGASRRRGCRDAFKWHQSVVAGGTIVRDVLSAATAQRGAGSKGHHADGCLSSPWCHGRGWNLLMTAARGKMVLLKAGTWPPGSEVPCEGVLGRGDTAGHWGWWQSCHTGERAAGHRSGPAGRISGKGRSPHLVCSLLEELLQWLNHCKPSSTVGMSLLLSFITSAC